MPRPPLLAFSVLLAACPGLGGRSDDDATPAPWDAADLPQGPQAPREPARAEVLDVWDGDTASFHLFDDPDSPQGAVRFLNIDTPETNDGSGNPECYASEATERTRQLLPEFQIVWLTWDGEYQDMFDRLLCHIFIGEEPSGTVDDWVNLQLVRDGFASAYIFDANDTFRAEFEAAEQEAQDAGRGMWGACP
jgi:micrococcal nuclease